jgi:hypothetical protein
MKIVFLNFSRKTPLAVNALACIIRIDLRVTMWEGADWIHLAQNRNKWRTFVNTVTNFRVP